jgi:hypothetical protein
VGPQCEIDSAQFAYPPGSLLTEPSAQPLHEKAPAAVARAYEDADFNAFHIRCTGKHVLIEVNGITAIDGDYPSLPDEGVIAWQLHGSRTPREIAFRNIQFTDLSAPGAADDFVPLFNGKDLTGWFIENGDAGHFAAEGGELIARGTGWKTQNFLLTDREVADYVLRLEFSLGERGNAGIAIRATRGETSAAVGGLPGHPLLKLTDPNNSGKEPVGTTHWVKDGQLYVQPAQVADVRQGWNRLEMEVRDRSLRVQVNDKLIVDMSGLNRQKGRVGLQAHTGAVHFRKIELKELPAGK